MIRAGSACIAVLLFCLQAGAQPISEPGERQTYSYLGLQANQLINLIFNSDATVSNPYLLTFSIIDRVQGTGFSGGIGYSYNQTREGDAFSSVDVHTSNLSFRVGLEKKMFIAQRWLWSICGDVVVSNLRETSKGANPSTSFVTEQSKTREAGFGPRCTINFAIADRVIVGTEASVYMKFGSVNHTVTGTSLPPQGQQKSHTFIPSLPSVIYLIVRF